MLKQVGSVVVAGLVGAMSYSAQGDHPNPLIPIALAGGAFLGASVLFAKLEPDLTVPIVAASQQRESSANVHDNGKKKGKKDVKKAKKEEPKVVEEPEAEASSDEEEKAAAAAAAKKKKSKDAKKSKATKEEVKKVAPVAAAEKKAETPKKGAAKKAATPVAAAPKKEEKKADKAPVKKAAAAAPKEEKKNAAKKKKNEKKKEETKPAVVATPASDDEALGDGWVNVTKRSKKQSSGDKKPSEKGTELSGEEKVKLVEKTKKVAPEHHGKILGTEGSILKRLEEKTRTKISVPKKGSNSNIITVSGTEEDVKNGLKAIEDIVELGYSQATNPGFTTEELTLREEKDKGLILGKEGVNVKAISKHFNVNIKTPPATLSGAAALKIAIVGEKADVKACKAELKRLLEIGYSPIAYPDFVTRSIPFPRSELKALMGVKGQNIKHITGSTHVHRINIPKVGAEDQSVTIIGTPTSVDKAEKEVLRYLQPEEPAAPEEAWAGEARTEDELWD